MKKVIFMLCLIISLSGCSTVHTQKLPENTSQQPPTPPGNSDRNHAGYARFTSGDKQYTGCWRTSEAPEVVKYELKYVCLTEKDIQVSKMPGPISFVEAESNEHKDYFVLHLSKKNKQLASYLNINIVSDDEMTIGVYSAKDLSNDRMEEYWNLKREDCQKVLKHLKEK